MAEAMKMFSEGMATPESLYVIIHGAFDVFRDMVEQGAVKIPEESSAFADAVLHDVAEAQACAYNKQRGI